MNCLAAVAAMTGLVSCGTGSVSVIHKTGSSPAQRITASDECKIASFREIPQTIATEVTPGYSTPSTVTCNTVDGKTSCDTSEGTSVAPSVTSYDVNEDLRNRFVDRCLASKGYQRIERPICTTKDEREAARAAAQSQPPANEIGCVSGNDGV